MKSTSIYNKLIIFLIAGLAIMPGCDILNLDENPKSFIAPEGFFQTADQIESVLAGTMGRSYSNWGGYSYNPAFHRHSDQNNGGNLIISQNYGAGVWNLHYNNIKDLNHGIKAIVNGNLEGQPASVVDPLMGQLKFLRSWNYFQLVRHWGAVPIVTEETVGYFTALPGRAPVAEVYTLIESDLLEAIAKLPADWGSRVGRPSRDVAKGMLAKVYVTMATAPLNEVSNYAKAAALAKEVMDGGKYSLVEDINEVFSFATEYGPEMMWSFNANDQHLSTDPRVWSAIHGWGDYSADRYWVDSVYPEQPRKYAYLEYYSQAGIPHHELGRGIGIKKYLYDTWENFARGYTRVNMPIIRYADVLLIFAEATNMANGGPTQPAVDAVNQLINRANGYEVNPDYPLLTTAMSRDDFDKAVIAERSYELCFEYDRWPDMLRKRIIPDVVRPEYVANFSPHIYLFPIPESEIRLNPNIEQNPGYVVQ
jgi:starch-binding outer membrane protein, SusD/RagB family